MPKAGSARRTRIGVLPWLLVGAGVLLIAAVLGMKWYTNLQQEKMLAAYAAMLEGAPAGQGTEDAPGGTPEGGQIAFITDEEEQSADGASANGPNREVTPIALMTIPKIDLKVVVGEGVAAKTLRYAVGHFTQTAQAGEVGNFSVIGHRNYTFGEFFNRLDELEAGDTILVERQGQTYTYAVTGKFVVEPQDTWVIDPDEGKEITLITCTPIRTATHRLIVKGMLVE